MLLGALQTGRARPLLQAADQTSAQSVARGLCHAEQWRAVPVTPCCRHPACRPAVIDNAGAVAGQLVGGIAQTVTLPMADMLKEYGISAAEHWGSWRL